MATTERNLKDKCYVATGNVGDRFVGIKASTERVSIHFPIGYQLSSEDKSLRKDVITLFRILASFMKQDKVISTKNFNSQQNVEFPLHSYLKIITKYLSEGKYYVESDPEYKISLTGKISWSRTIKSQIGLIQNGNLIFTKTISRNFSPKLNKQITQIHKFCVYDAFDKLGWIYISSKPEFPGHPPSVKESIQILNKKKAQSHNDNEQELFQDMLNILKYIDNENSNKDYFFGTDYFERVWEGMIDKAFGVNDKQKYFPESRWLLRQGFEKEKRALCPDSIMIYNDKFYVLDAKYYRYGFTGNVDHLPNSADINKQITYGEYIYNNFQIYEYKLFNAFLLPYNMNDNPFNLRAIFGNIGEAVGGWRKNDKFFERIQGIVIDTRFLMYNYLRMSDRYKQELSNTIESFMAIANGTLP